jgi:hypothetical protein
MRFLASAEKDHPAALTAVRPTAPVACNRLPSFNMLI